MLFVILFSLLALLLVQVTFLLRNKTLSMGRKWLRAGLNALLWLLVAAYVWQPTWPDTHPAKHALLVADDVPGAVARQVKDSLRIRDQFTARTLKADYDSITLLGQNFATETLTKLSRTALQWVPYNPPGKPVDVRWRAIVREGEMQQITGRIVADKPQILAVRYGNRTLDSLQLREGETTFALRFPAFVRGQTQVALAVDGTVTDTLRFFGRALKPLTVQFLLNSPDFESKTLADWLGQHGHTVRLTTTLSKNVSTDIRINPNNANATPDLLITDPANADNAAVRKAVTDGRAVLFMNLTNAEAECRLINRATGSRWAVRRTSAEPTVPIGNGLTTLPYRFADALNQFTAPGYPIAAQQTPSGRVGISLLTETYPLALSGDSLTYSRIWTAALARLYPNDANALLADAPPYSRALQPIRVNRATKTLEPLRVGTDTLPLIPSPLNEATFEGSYWPEQASWQTVADSVAVYCEGSSFTPDYQRETVRRFVRAHAYVRNKASQKPLVQTVPNWLWLALFLLVFSALWLEPKLH